MCITTRNKYVSYSCKIRYNIRDIRLGRIPRNCPIESRRIRERRGRLSHPQTATALTSPPCFIASRLFFHFILIFLILFFWFGILFFFLASRLLYRAILNWSIKLFQPFQPKNYLLFGLFLGGLKFFISYNATINILRTWWMRHSFLNLAESELIVALSSENVSSGVIYWYVSVNITVNNAR